MGSMWSSGVQIILFTRSWTRHVAEEKQERARTAANQQRVAEQHHRQVLVKGMWEGLGQAVALRRLAHRDAHRHFQLYRQRQVAPQHFDLKQCLLCVPDAVQRCHCKHLCHKHWHAVLQGISLGGDQLGSWQAYKFK